MSLLRLFSSDFLSFRTIDIALILGGYDLNGADKIPTGLTKTPTAPVLL